MKKEFSIALSLFILLIACGKDPVAVETGTIQGTVYNFDTGEIIGKAHIFTIPPSSAVTTDSINGTFKILHVDPGVYRVISEKTTFDSTGVNVTVLADEKTIADIALKVSDSTAVDTTGS